MERATLLLYDQVSQNLTISSKRNQRDLKITAQLLDFLIEYPWPGNVREMQNMVERMVILAEGNHLTIDDLPSRLRHRRYEPATTLGTKLSPATPDDHHRSGKSLEEIERQEIEASLKRNGWVQIRAARELGLTQRQFGYRIKKYGLSRYNSFS